MSALPLNALGSVRALLLAGGLAASIGASAHAADIERGRRLFNGELPLTGAVVGHSAALPAQASRCANCHAAASAPPSVARAGLAAGAGAASTQPQPQPQPQSFGPALNAKVLLQPTPRRGGPPSHYDEAALCKLLSTGVDPAYIVMPVSMPRYELAPGDCKALWAYLTQPRP